MAPHSDPTAPSDPSTTPSITPQGVSGADGSDELEVLSSEELLERVRDGDEQAAATLYRRYYAPLLRFAFSYVRTRADAEEVVQEVFLAVWERRASLAIQVSVTAYLYTAVRNWVLRTAKHGAVVARTETAAAAAGDRIAMGTPPLPPDVQIEHAELAQQVARAVDGLSERRRLALTLRWRHQLPYAEIAAIMGASVEAVTIQVARARDQVARALRASMEME